MTNALSVVGIVCSNILNKKSTRFSCHASLTLICHIVNSSFRLLEYEIFTCTLVPRGVILGNAPFAHALGASCQGYAKGATKLSSLPAFCCYCCYRLFFLLLSMILSLFVLLREHSFPVEANKEYLEAVDYDVGHM